MNKLYYGDNLDVSRRHIHDESAVSSGADHSPPPGVALLRKLSAEIHSQAISRSAKLLASIWSSGEYFLPPMSPA